MLFDLPYENKRLITQMILLFFSFNFWYVRSPLKSVKEGSEIYDVDINLLKLIWAERRRFIFLAMLTNFIPQRFKHCICVVETYCIGAMNPSSQPSGADIYSTTEINIRCLNLNQPM